MPEQDPELQQKHIFSDRELWTVMKEEAAYTIHVPDTHPPFLFGTYYNEMGEPVQHQVEYEGGRVNFPVA